MNIKKIKQSRVDICFDAVNYILLALLGVCFLYPLWFVCIASVSDPNEIWQGNVILFPKGFTFASYKQILKHSEIWTGYANSLFYTFAGTLISLALTVSAAFPMSRKDFKARGFLMGLYTVTMFFSGGMIPAYLLVKSLNMIDTVWAILLPGSISVYNVIVMRTYFSNSIPEELHEAASIDGCTNFRYLFRMVLPLSKSIIAVIALFYGVAKWNDYFSALIYLSTRSKMPLQIFLRELLLQSQITTEMTGTDTRWAAEQQKIAESIKYGIIVVASIPTLVMYPFVQKHFVKGVMIGSVKA